MGNTQVQGKTSKGAPSKARSASRKAKYTSYRNRATADFNALRALKRHIIENPNDAVAKAKIVALSEKGIR